MADHTLWDDVIPKLDSKSVEFSDPSYGKTIEEMAAYTLTNAPAKFDLVGFSMGGLHCKSHGAFSARASQKTCSHCHFC